MKKIILLIVAILLVWFAYKLYKDPGGTGLWILNKVIALGSSYETSRDIPYGEKPWQALDVYQPLATGDRQNDVTHSKPVIVFFFGGGWAWGDKADFEFIADSFIRKGYVVAIPDYVLYPEGKYPQFLNDSALAIDWVHKNIHAYGGDPTRINLVGHSAGAYNAAMIATNDKYLNAIGSSPDIIRAFAGVSGPYNFTPRAQTFIDIFGEENFEEMKVMNHVSGNEPPMLLLHAEDDSTVALFNQATMASMLEGNQIPVKSILYDAGIGHIRMLLNIHPWFANEANVGHDIDNFLKQHNDDATEVPKG